MKRLHNRELGMIAELRVASRAIEKGFAVLRPTVDFRQYDLLLEKDQEFKRVQIKSSIAAMGKNDSFRFRIRYGSTGNKKGYTKDDVDYVCCYIRVLDIMYLIPIEKLTKMSIIVYPFKEDCKYNEYMDNWEI